MALKKSYKLLLLFFFTSCEFDLHTDSSNQIKNKSYKIVYFENTHIVKDSIELDRGQKHGWTFRYNKNGRLESKQHFFENQAIGDSYSFYENGIPKIYNCYDEHGNNMRVKIYDSSGKIVKNEGYIICQAVFVGEKSIGFVNKPIYHDVICSKAPHELVELKYRILELNENYELIPMSENFLRIKHIINSSGTYNLQMIGTSYNFYGVKVKCDTLISKIHVYDTNHDVPR